MVYVQRPNLTFVAGCRTPCSMAVVPRTSVVLSTLPNGANAVLVRVPETGLVLDVPSPNADPTQPVVYGRDWGPVTSVPSGRVENLDLILIGVGFGVVGPGTAAMAWLSRGWLSPLTRLPRPESPPADPMPYIAAGLVTTLLGPLVAGTIGAIRSIPTPPLPPGFRPLVAFTPIVSPDLQGLTIVGLF